ncbi:response regulator [Alteromonas sp. BL110]|uniref:ATP-binding protein n=1 Tax=Alteromonas sp. BL110 TaxID=1714845 RepID=UPI000E4CF269|nr:ATP-binding protein [Alteromonas sp. BL110]AXT40672.1 response regulator [Alteromonas sp. BL110]RKM79908.1 response regulator [Alteromonas sp. BL110]
MSVLPSKPAFNEAKSTFILAVVLATLLIVLVVSLFESNIKATAESQAFEALEKSALSVENVAEMQVVKYLNALNFLHQTPPISGIVRATQNDKLDPKDGTTLDQWKHRLETIFVAFIENNREIDQLRVIKADVEGNEFLRVEREGGSVLIANSSDLQAKASRNYFIESVKSNQGQFYISGINLNREYGKLEYPYKSVIRLSLPIFSESGERYGLLIMNVNAQYLLSQMTQTLTTNQTLYVTDREGYFVLHPDGQKSFSKDLNPSVTWQSEFSVPQFKGRTKITPEDETQGVHYAVSRAFTIGAKDQSATFYLHILLPQSEVSALINEKRLSVYSVIGIVSIIFVSILLFVYRSNTKNIELAKVRGESAAIVDISKDAIFSVDSTGIVKSWNKAAESLFGIPPQIIINHHYSSFAPLSLLGLEDVLVKGGKQVTFNKPYVDDDNDEHSLLITASTIWGEHLQFSGVAVVIRDVTDEQKAKDAIERVNLRLEEKVVSRTKELVEATQEARKASKVKSSFISNISHEMRTPLNGVVGSLALLKRQPLNEKAEQLVSMMEISCNNLNVLINDVLDLSKIEAGKLDINQQSFELLSLIESIAKVFAIKAAGRGLELLVDTSEVPKIEINSDPHRINQVLSNLLNNAIKFTETGHVKLTLFLSEPVSGVQRLHFSVEDTGVGIAKDNQPKLFSAFTQADASVATQYGGTGLGLSICKQLCQLLGGDITFESELGMGSKFSFYISVPDTASGKSANSDQIEREEKSLLSHIKVGVSSAYLPLQAHIGKLAEYVGATPHVLDTPASAIPWEDYNILLLDESSALIGELDKEWERCEKDGKASKMPVVYILQKLEGAPYEFTHLTPLYLPKPLFRSTFVTVKQGLDAVKYSGLINKATYEDSHSSTLEDEARAEEQVKPHFSIENSRLLIVDDNMINREVAKGVLECLPCKLYTCADGEEVIAFLRKCDDKGRRIHSILMDCQMPKMNGYEATRAIREGKAGAMHVDVPIIAMTANAMLGEKEKCLAAGMNDFATKPVIADVLIPKVRQWLVNQVTKLAGIELKNSEIDTQIGERTKTPLSKPLEQTSNSASVPPLVDSLLGAIDRDLEQSADESMNVINHSPENNASDDVFVQSELGDALGKPESISNERANAIDNDCWEKEDAIARIMGDKALFSRVCELYSQSAPEKFKLLDRAVEEQDFAQVQVLSLKLKGMSADIGAVQLQKDFEALWELSKVADWVKVKALIPSIGDDLNTFLELLEVA